MWSRASTDRASSLYGAAIGVLIAAIAAMGLAACGSAPSKPTQTPPAPVATNTATSTSTAPAPAGQSRSAATGAPATPVEITPRAQADFDRAVGFMRAGNNIEAELEFKQVALQFPQLAAPYVNLG